MTKFQMVLTFGKGNKRRIVETTETQETYREARHATELFADVIANNNNLSGWSLVQVSHDPDRDVEVPKKCNDEVFEQTKGEGR